MPDIIDRVAPPSTFMSSFHPNQRLSYDGRLCTVRYVGEIADTSGTWIGVEWDEAHRGKHSGEHKGVKYFDCLCFLAPARAPADGS